MYTVLVKYTGEWESFKTIEEAKLNALWGTFNKNGVKHCNGKCPLHQLRYIRLIDCESSHLFAILGTQHQLRFTKYPVIIESILEDRGFNRNQIEIIKEIIHNV